MASILPPIEVMVNWPQPNFVDPPSQAPLLLAIEIPMFILCLIVVALRFVSRMFLTVSRIRLDDILMLMAAFSCGVLVLLNCLAIKYGWGLHAWDINLAWLQPAQKLAFGTEICFVFCMVFTKLSIFAFYIRVFSTYEMFRRLAWLGIALLMIWAIGSLATIIFQCKPVQAFWEFVPNAKCLDMYVAIMAVSITNSITDVYLFLLPIRWVWALCLPKKQRVALVVAFGLGLIACFAGFFRLHYLKLMFQGPHDMTWHGAPLYIATAVEINLAVVTASLPALKPLFLHISQNGIHMPNAGVRSRAGSLAHQPGHPITRRPSNFDFVHVKGESDVLERGSEDGSETGKRKNSLKKLKMNMMGVNSGTTDHVERVFGGYSFGGETVSSSNSRRASADDNDDDVGPMGENLGRGRTRGMSVQVTYVIDDEEAQLYKSYDPAKKEEQR